jgi:hypothetical protein
MAVDGETIWDYAWKLLLGGGGLVALGKYAVDAYREWRANREKAHTTGRTERKEDRVDDRNEWDALYQREKTASHEREDAMQVKIDRLERELVEGRRENHEMAVQMAKQSAKLEFLILWCQEKGFVAPPVWANPNATPSAMHRALPEGK